MSSGELNKTAPEKKQVHHSSLLFSDGQREATLAKLIFKLVPLEFETTPTKNQLPAKVRPQYACVEVLLLDFQNGAVQQLVAERVNL